jgi:hypothetical protein
MACAGNPSEICGGPFRLDLYSYGSVGTAPTSTQTSTSPSSISHALSGWTFLGCYTDNVSGRALPHGVTVPGGTNYMTNEVCQASCLRAGYSIAGTEYAGECCKFSQLVRLETIDINHF